MRGPAACAIAVLAALALAAPAAAVPVPAITPPVTVVPSAGLPAGMAVDRSNANLSVTRFRGRVWMVFRTAKWQIADDNARLYVVSSADQRHWRFEGSFAYGRDLREPRPVRVEEAPVPLLRAARLQRRGL